MSAPAAATTAAPASSSSDAMSDIAPATAAAASADESNGAAAAGTEEEEEDDEEARLILEEYKIWKKNTPYLYDCVVSHALEWPSLTVQWLPDRVLTEGFSEQRLILGTHTSQVEEEGVGANAASAASAAAGSAAAAGTAATAAASSSSALPPQNYLMIAKVLLPHGDPALARGGGSNGASGAAAAASASSSAVDLDGYGPQQGKIEIVQYIPHKGEVNRARYSPHNPNLIATKSSHASVLVFDRSKHSSNTPPFANQPPPSTEFKPDLVLEGHTAEGYGLAWNPHASTQGLLLSGSNDSLVCMWDISGASKKAASNIVQPLHTFRGHSNVVEDVAWSNFHAEQFASCGDDQKLLLWDTRTPKDPTASLNKASQHHTGNINCISFNHFTEFILASGASDGLIHLWDLRRTHAPIHTLSPHRHPSRSKTSSASNSNSSVDILNLQFSPFSQDILASSGSDRRAYVWDLTRIGASLDPAEEDEAAAEDAEGDLAPPELLFAHGGHTDKIADLSWNSNVGEEWMIATVADDNILQIWQISESVYAEDEADAAPTATLNGHDIEEIE